MSDDMTAMRAGLVGMLMQLRKRVMTALPSTSKDHFAQWDGALKLVAKHGDNQQAIDFANATMEQLVNGMKSAGVTTI